MSRGKTDRLPARGLPTPVRWKSETISSADFGATKIDITLPCQTADDGLTPRHNSTGISSGIGRTA
jgi:hypothetical protein